MSDDANGDAMFVDDIYSASPDELGLSQSRIAQIDEIRAGAGNDVVDMTSQRFEYIGDGLTIRGGDGNDTIWANKGDNWLFGDAGNDRIIGASGNDVIAGGIGNDRMHGGGGDDIFTFCDNWGKDTVEQLAGGSVTLWFASEMEGKVAWDDGSQSYTDGVNQVSVKGVPRSSSNSAMTVRVSMPRLFLPEPLLNSPLRRYLRNRTAYWQVNKSTKNNLCAVTGYCCGVFLL